MPCFKKSESLANASDKITCLVWAISFPCDSSSCPTISTNFWWCSTYISAVFNWVNLVGNSFFIFACCISCSIYMWNSGSYMYISWVSQNCFSFKPTWATAWFSTCFLIFYSISWFSSTNLLYSSILFLLSNSLLLAMWSFGNLDLAPFMQMI